MKRWDLLLAIFVPLIMAAGITYTLYKYGPHSGGEPDKTTKTINESLITSLELQVVINTKMLAAIQKLEKRVRELEEDVALLQTKVKQ